MGGAIALYKTFSQFRALGWGRATAEEFTSVNTIVTDADGQVIADDATQFVAIFANQNKNMNKTISIGQQLVLSSLPKASTVTFENVKSGEIFVVKVMKIDQNKITMEILAERLPKEENDINSAALHWQNETQVPQGSIAMEKLLTQIQNGYSLHFVSTSQLFQHNKANESGGGAIFWDSDDSSDKPFVEPILGSVRFLANKGTYGNNIASAGFRLQGEKFYTANNTLPFGPVVQLEDYYSQTVVNFDIAQSITVFAKASDKLFGKTDSTMESTGFAHFPTVGMAAEPGVRNCSFISSSSRIANFNIQVSINDCPLGNFLRNQESEVRAKVETATGKLLRYDEQLNCPQGENCRWECVNCPIGRFSFDRSPYECMECPKGFVQPKTGQQGCEACPIGKYAREAAATICDNAEIDTTLPFSFPGLRFLADISPYQNSLSVVWDQQIDIAIINSRTDASGKIDGIQIRISLGNAAFFDSKVIATKNIAVNETGISFDLNSKEIEAKCKTVLFGLFCLPLHQMKYYTQVRVYTNNGKVGQNAFPAETWTVASECSDREYLDDYSCPYCQTKRKELTVDANNNNQESQNQLKTLPTSEELNVALVPGNRLLNPLMWTCMDCPEGGTCQGDILYSGITSLFGWWRVELGTRPEQFQRCLFPPACLGAPNLDLVGRYYDSVCINTCKADCNTIEKNIVGSKFDQNSCEYKCGFNTTCDLAMQDIIECGSIKWWGDIDYSGPKDWPGYENTPSLPVLFSSFIFELQKGALATSELVTNCKDSLYGFQNSTSSRHEITPTFPVPDCNDDAWKETLGARTNFLPVHAVIEPKFTEIVPDPPYFLESQNQQLFYTNTNRTTWSINATRICQVYEWQVVKESDIESDIDYATKTQIIKEGGRWIFIEDEQICSTTKTDVDQEVEREGLHLPFTDITTNEQKKMRDFGDWIVYDLERIVWWDNITNTRSIEIRGMLYSALGEPNALASDIPSINILVESPGAKFLEVSFRTKTAKKKSEGSTFVQIRKSKATMCNMGFEDPSQISAYSKCDRGIGLICERCDTEHGYMQDCVNPKGSRCRLCASCAPGYKRAGQARCKKCPPSLNNRILMAGGILVMILAGTLLIYMAIEAADAKDNISDAMKKIVINYLQVTSLAAGFPLKWPEAVETMFAYMSSFSSVGQHLLSPDCELTELEPAEAFYSKQVGFASLPILIFVVSKLLWSIIIPWFHHCTKIDPKKLKAHESPVYRPLSFYMDRTVLTDIVFFYFLYPTLVKQAISMFACNKIGGEWYLSADLQETCFQGRHLWW